MRLRTFTADNARDAIERVRDELGPDAIIIALDEAANGRGVIVRAAVEGDAEETPAMEPEPALPPEQRLERLLLARLDAWGSERLSEAAA